MPTWSKISVNSTASNKMLDTLSRRIRKTKKQNLSLEKSPEIWEKRKTWWLWSKVSNKQVQQIIEILKNNWVLQKKESLQYVEALFNLLPIGLVGDIYNLYHENELLKIKYNN